MPYTLPTFNIRVNFYTSNNFTAPPRVADAPANLAWGRRVQVPSTGGTFALGVPLLAMQLLLPSTVDARGQYSSTGTDAVEIPSGSGRFYHCYLCDYIGYGFPNEHKCALVVQHNPFLTPDV